MQKQAPSIGRILVAVGFTLSCFGLLLFLWVTFGGPVPFKPESYRFTADFPEAITLSKEADVRIGGVSVGKVKSLGLAPESECHTNPTVCNTTRATIEIDPQYAPISSDAQGDPPLEDAARGDLHRAHQRQPGAARPDRGDVRPSRARSTSVRSRAATPHNRSPRAATSPRRRSRTRPRSTRSSRASTSRRARRSSPGCRTPALAINGRGLDLNDAFGNLGPVRLGRERRARHAAQPGAVAAHARPRHGRRLRRPHRARPGARRRDRRRQPDLRRARLAEPGALRHLQDLPDLREREPPHARPAEDVRRGRAAGVPRPAAGGPRPEPDAARRAQARPEGPEALPEPRSADQGVGDGAAVAEQLPARAAAGDGRARSVPRELQSAGPLARLPGAGGHRLPLQPVLLDRQSSCRSSRARARRSTSRAR